MSNVISDYVVDEGEGQIGKFLKVRGGDKCSYGPTKYARLTKTTDKNNS